MVKPILGETALVVIDDPEEFSDVCAFCAGDAVQLLEIGNDDPEHTASCGAV
jgi:hypothetical protein